MINVVVHPLLPLILIVLSFIARRMVEFLIRVILAVLNTIVLTVTTNTLRGVIKRVDQVLMTPQNAYDRSRLRKK